MNGKDIFTETPLVTAVTLILGIRPRRRKQSNTLVTLGTSCGLKELWDISGNSLSEFINKRTLNSPYCLKTLRFFHHISTLPTALVHITRSYNSVTSIHVFCSFSFLSFLSHFHHWESGRTAWRDGVREGRGLFRYLSLPTIRRKVNNGCARERLTERRHKSQHSLGCSNFTALQIS